MNEDIQEQTQQQQVTIEDAQNQQASDENNTKNLIITLAKVSNNNEKVAEGGGVTDIKNLVDLPLARVKRIMKSDVDVKLISQEAVVLVTKAAELLLEHLAEESCKYTTSENRKTIQYKDVAQAVKECDVFDFLEEVIPERYTLQSLVESRAGKKL
jgi:histone H3/H4